MLSQPVQGRPKPPGQLGPTRGRGWYARSRDCTAFRGNYWLKPKHVKSPTIGQEFNYITDIRAKWYRNYFYFFSIYACPGPDALSPTFESKFARMEPLGGGKFALYSMRYTGKEWVGIGDQLSVDECMKAIRDDAWFVP